MSRTDFVSDLFNKLMQFEKTGNRDSSVGIATGYVVANQLRFMTKEPNPGTFGNQRAV
jgi:hypothetical protein